MGRRLLDNTECYIKLGINPSQTHSESINNIRIYAKEKLLQIEGAPLKKLGQQEKKINYPTARSTFCNKKKCVDYLHIAYSSSETNPTSKTPDFWNKLENIKSIAKNLPLLSHDITELFTE